MIQSLLNFTINCTANQTTAEQISEIATQPYFVTGYILLICFLILSIFIVGFSKIIKDSNKIGFQSPLYLKFVIVMLFFAVIYILYFIVGIPFMWA